MSQGNGSLEKTSLEDNVIFPLVRLFCTIFVFMLECFESPTRTRSLCIDQNAPWLFISLAGSFFFLYFPHGIRRIPLLATIVRQILHCTDNVGTFTPIHKSLIYSSHVFNNWIQLLLNWFMCRRGGST